MSGGRRIIDETGRRYGSLTVIGLKEKTDGGRNRAYWICRCDCGREKPVLGDHLRSGATSSCSCHGGKKLSYTGNRASKTIDELGNRYGHLTVIERQRQDNIGGEARWICRCDCGQETVVTGSRLRRGRSMSCGCTSWARKAPGYFEMLDALKRSRSWISQHSGSNAILAEIDAAIYASVSHGLWSKGHESVPQSQ